MTIALSKVLETMNLFRLILYFRSKPIKSLYYTSNTETIYFENLL